MSSISFLSLDQKLSRLNVSSFSFFVSEYAFMMFKPSLIASGCILAAYNGLLSATNTKFSSTQLQELQSLSKHTMSEVTNASLLVEKIIQQETTSSSNQSTSSNSNKSVQHSSNNKLASNNNNTSSHTKEKPDTPIDVQDVRF